MPSREDFTEDEVKVAYSTARDVCRGDLTSGAGKQFIVKRLGARSYTAAQFVEAYPAMIDGSLYKKTLSDLAVEVYVEAITDEHGLAKRELALQAVLKNIEFWEKNESKRRGRPVSRKSQRILHQMLLSATNLKIVYPDDVGEAKTYQEGAVTQVLVNRYERDPEARAAAIAHYGCKCSACGFDFEAKYGELGSGFIHVHHIVDIATIGTNYQVDPIKDLRPVCPNCHAMLHTEKPAMGVSVLADLIAAQAEPQP
ncbi:HNH endonuclease [Paraburkholderia sp. BL25I1N1]|uniref:HNH endonuclease n=1 Tax=Paraburkholderia sp. BL25I1N1 TaxID=1938804 RepID=UPI000D4AEF95|nr:HNH endonuclease [Paraburkholderia sp. BL25I1N1]PRY03200.1 5-methylcytosine-specific restriction protein A [Paraburkholderia sp. BL25I1N1]